MKRTLIVMFLCATFGLLFSSCATLVGGAKYNARVRVPDHPNAKININGQYRGNGEATMLINRKEANMLNVTIQEGNDEPQTTVFSGRKFRTGTLIADLFLPPFPPFGAIIIDAISGSWWRPDESEIGVSRIDVDNYQYIVNYRENNPKKTQNNSSTIPDSQPVTNEIKTQQVPQSNMMPNQQTSQSKAEALRELKKLLDEGVLTPEEYDKEKAKLLDSN